MAGPDDGYEAGQDNVRIFGLDVHNPVFVISGGVIVLFLLVMALFNEAATGFFGWLRPAVTDASDWFLVIAGNIFVIFTLVLIFTPFGKIRLGGPDARPDFSRAGWFAMLFAAGMGIGLMFYGVGEPVSHFTAAFADDAGQPGSWAPLGGAAGDADGARRLAMAATIYHWALHPWAIYAVVALSLAFFSYNRGTPLTMRAPFVSLLGRHTWGWPGHVIDVLAVFATLFGLATSLGIGAEQANAGLNHLFGLGVSDQSKILLIVGITAVALYSVVAGIDAGVKRLSELNMIMAGLLLLFVILAGPTLTIIGGFFRNLGAYFSHLPALSNPFGRTDRNFLDGWTAFYWAWWISWSPFVGMFIARVSRGRTVREFLISVLLIPASVCVLWMTTFGEAAISQIVEKGRDVIAAAPLELQLFVMLEDMPLAGLSSLLGIALVVVFFVTSSDSGSLVIDQITAGGKDDAPTPQRVFWAVSEGLVAIVLLMAGGLGALQAAAVTTGVPFAVVLLLMCVAIWKGLAGEKRA